MRSRRVVGRKFFLGTSVVALFVFAGSMALFLAFPRIGLGFFFDKKRGNITMAGFSDGVTLGGHGLIKKDDTVVMRVEVDSKYRGRGAPYLHWRGVAFDEYDGGRWKRSRRAPQTRRHVQFGTKVDRHHILYAGNRDQALPSAL